MTISDSERVERVVALASGQVSPQAGPAEDEGTRFVAERMDDWYRRPNTSRSTFLALNVLLMALVALVPVFVLPFRAGIRMSDPVTAAVVSGGFLTLIWIGTKVHDWREKRRERERRRRKNAWKLALLEGAAMGGDGIDLALLRGHFDTTDRELLNEVTIESIESKQLVLRDGRLVLPSATQAPATTEAKMLPSTTSQGE